MNNFCPPPPHCHTFTKALVLSSQNHWLPPSTTMPSFMDDPLGAIISDTFLTLVWSGCLSICRFSLTLKHKQISLQIKTCGQFIQEIETLYNFFWCQQFWTYLLWLKCINFLPRWKKMIDAKSFSKSEEKVSKGLLWSKLNVFARACTCESSL